MLFALQAQLASASYKNRCAIQYQLTATMFFQSLLGAALALAATANPIRDHQQPVFGDGFEGQQVDLIKEFVFILEQAVDEGSQ